MNAEGRTNDKRVLAIVHRLVMGGQVKKGGLDIILDHLIARGYSVTLVEFQLAGKLAFPRGKALDTRGFCVVRRVSKGEETRLAEVRFPNVPEPIRWGLEVLRIPSILRPIGPLPDVVVAADPLCCLAARRLIRRRMTRRLHFHCVDYSDARFGKRALDWAYNRLYRHAVRTADTVDVVSTSLFEVVKTFLDGRTEKVSWLPNSPEFDGYPFLEPGLRNLHTLACSTAAVEPIYRIEEALTILAGLKDSFPDARLLLLGSTDANPKYVGELKRKAAAAGVESRIEWRGVLPRDEARKAVSECGIGLCYYDAGIPQVTYLDSLKIREYAASGLPTVGDDTCATIREARDKRAGYVVRNGEEAVTVIADLWRNPDKYADAVRSARAWAMERDKSRLLEELRNRIGLP